jgi:heme o synthase
MKTLDQPLRVGTLGTAKLLEPPETPTLEVSRTPSRQADFLELTKPRIAVMALVTVAAGYLLGAAENFSAIALLNTLLGSGLVAAGGSALNHLIERRADAKMHRTARRPIPTGRILPWEALIFGVSLAVSGTAYLYWVLPEPAAAIAAGATALMYVAIYTPMKRWTSWNTIVGAIPGALPPIIGWCAARGSVNWEAASLFAILFVWQLPHFYSIAFMHREDYARGGMKMLPVVEGPSGFYTGLATVLTATLLVAVTVMPFAVGAANYVYLIAALPLSLWFVARTIRFHQNRTPQTARTVLRGSLVYLVGVMALLVVDGILPRYW